MQKYNLFNSLLITFFFVMSNTMFAANLQRTVLYFDKDKSVLTAAEKQKIKDVAESDVIFLYGHTDSDGDNAYNLRLSEKRVKEVAKLIASISPDKKLDLQYFGETEALNANKDEAEKTLNRRVEVVFISDPILSFKTEKQKFTIDNSKDQTITCKEGTVIEIPKGAFENKMIEIEVSEHYKPLEILSENLTTVSDGKPLQTQGMIHIAAFDNGKTIQSSKEITYKFPKKDKVNDDYEFFSGVRNSDYEMNWKAKESNLDTSDFGNNTNAYTNIIIGGCVATEDVYSEAGIYFDKLKDDVSNLQYNSLNHVCLNEAKINVIINPSGKIDTISTNYKIKNCNCDKILKEYILKFSPKTFKNKYNYIYSSIDYEFNNFLSDEFKSQNKKLLEKDKNPFVSEEYISRKTTSKKQMAKAANNAELYKYTSNEPTEFDEDYYNTISMMSYVTLSSIKLGWVNCDRFNYTTDRVDFKINTPKIAVTKLILKNLGGFFRNECYDGCENSVFYKVPKNEPAILISTYKKGGKIFLAIAETTTSNQTFSGLQYQEISYSDLKKKLADLKI